MNEGLFCYYKELFFIKPFPSSYGGKSIELESLMRRRMPPFPQAEKEFGLHVM